MLAWAGCCKMASVATWCLPTAISVTERQNMQCYSTSPKETGGHRATLQTWTLLFAKEVWKCGNSDWRMRKLEWCEYMWIIPILPFRNTYVAIYSLMNHLFLSLCPHLLQGRDVSPVTQPYRRFVLFRLSCFYVFHAAKSVAEKQAHAPIARDLKSALVFCG